MKVDISYNEELNGIELHFSEKPSPDIISEIKTKMGFRYNRNKNLWWAKKNKQRVTFAETLQETLSKQTGAEKISISVEPSHAPSEENIKHRKFSYVTLWYKGKDGNSTTEKYVLFEPSKNVAIDIATQFGKNTYGDRFERVDVYPRNYVRDARKLLAAGKVIAGTGNTQPPKTDDTVWVVYSSTGTIDSLQISEQKAKEYIQRRPEFSRDKMKYERVDAQKANSLWEKEKDRQEDSLETKIEVKDKELTELFKYLQNLGVLDKHNKIDEKYLEHLRNTQRDLYQSAIERLQEMDTLISEVQKLNQQKYTEFLEQENKHTPTPVDGDTWVVYNSKDKIDSLQISEQKAKEYIQRRPEFSRSKMSIKQMPTKEAYSLWDKQVAETENSILSKKEKLEILTKFGKFHEKRKAEFPEVEIEEHEIPIQFKSWLRANHPELLEQKDSIWEEYETVQSVLNTDPNQAQIPKKDYRLFFTRFRELAKVEIGQITGSASLEAFTKWLEENYTNIAETDKKGIIAFYADFIEEIKKDSKAIENLSKGKKIQPYSAIFNKLNKVIPDLEKNLKKGWMSGKSSFGEKSALMDLNLDVLSEDDKGRFVIAISHYYLQNGDSIADPDMEIRINFEMETAEALTFQNGLGFQQVYHTKDGKKLLDTRQKKEQNKFLSGWLTNLINTKHKIIWDEIDTPEITNKLTNDVGVYTQETAGENFETIEIPIPKSAKYSATIYLVKDENEQYRFGLSNRKEFGDASGGSFLPNDTDKTYKSRDYAFAVALGDLLIRITAFIQRTDTIFNNEEKKNKQLMSAFEAIKSYAVENNIEPVFQEEAESKEQKPLEIQPQIGQGWTNLDEKTIAAFQKLIDDYPDKLNIEKEESEYWDVEENENPKTATASITSDKDRISFQVYKNNTMLISSLTPLSEGITYGGSTMSKTKVKKAIQHMIKYPELLGEQQITENTQIIKDLDAALWQESDNEYPVNQVVIKGITYHQSRLRELLLTKLNKQPLDVQLELIQSLAQLFKERRPYSGITKIVDSLSKSEEKKEKENIRSYVDDIIIDNDLWQLKITEGEAKSVDGVMAWLISQLFESAEKLVDKPTK